MHGSLTEARKTWWLLVFLLAASLTTMGLLVARALYADRSHRETAEGVLRDYAALAGDEALRRAQAQLGYYGYVAALDLLRRSLNVVPGVDLAAPPPTVEQLAASANAREQRALELLRRTFVLDAARGGGFALEGPPLALPVAVFRESVVEALQDLGEADEFAVAFAPLEGGEALLVFAPLVPASADEMRAGVVAGFEVDRAAAREWVVEAMGRAPLLPPSLAKGELNNDSLYMRMTDATGQVLYSSGDRSASRLRVERSVPDDYVEVLPGLTVEAAIGPQAAGKLVVGGLPRSSRTLFLGLALVAGGLLVAAILLLRRERALGRLRTDFVSRVSHELRTPLTQILMFAETLRLDRVRNDADRRRALEIISRESRRLNSLVENVLQFSRSERGVAELAPRRLVLAPFIAELVEEFEPLLGKESRLVVENDVLTVAVVDEDCLRQVLLNLLDNAVKYGPKSQEIRLGVAATDSVIRLWVDDEGPGIRSSDRDLVWLPFRRLDRGGRAVTGTGIGLAVVRDLMNLQGGTCWIEEGSRGGTRVVVELPIEQPAAVFDESEVIP